MKDIRRTIHIRVPREEVFNAITNPLTIELWTGYPAEMETVPGTRFTIFDGDITGIMRTVDPPSLIEQEWDFGEQQEPSIVQIELFEESNQTRVEVRHTNIPDEAFDNIDTGWREYYLGALKAYLEH